MDDRGTVLEPFHPCCFASSQAIDTTATTMQFFVQLMAEYPEAQRRIQAELDAVVPASNFVEEKDVANMPFFWACIKETMRFRRLASGIIPRLTNSTIHWSGFEIPPNTFMVMPLLSTFCPDGDKFDPLRFLDNPRVDTLGHKEPQHLPFGEVPDSRGATGSVV